MLTRRISSREEESSVKLVGSFMAWNNANLVQKVCIFRDNCGCSMLKLKSPVIIMSFMPESTARCLLSGSNKRDQNWVDCKIIQKACVYGY